MLRSATLLMTLAMAPPACAPPSAQPPGAGYLVTLQPIAVWRELRSCVAVQPGSVTGIWHWQPHWDHTRADCECRSTGPGVTRADNALLEQRPSGDTVVRYRLGLHSTVDPSVAVELLLSDGRLRHPVTGDGVRVQPRKHLDIPECR